MGPNVTTMEQQNIFRRKNIWGYLTSTSAQKQTLDNNDRSMEDKLELTNKGTPVQQGSNRSAEKGTKKGTLDTNERLGMGLPETDENIWDETHNPANEVHGLKDDLLYGGKTASKWNDETGLHTSGDVQTQRPHHFRNIILEKMDEVMRREVTPAPRTIMELYGIPNVDTDEAGQQRIAVTIAEMYACDHSGT